MKCPVDGAELVMTERSGVEIDYCPQCRGVWLDRGDALPRRLEVREPGGSLRTIDLTGLKPDAPVGEKTFSFEVPKGARVVEG